MAISLTLAVKFHYDKYESKTVFYAITTLSRRQFRVMFDSYLELVDFNLVVQEEEFEAMTKKIKTLVAKKFL